MPPLTRTQRYREQILAELPLAYAENRAAKDVLVVVHDQYDYVRACLGSVLAHTDRFRLLVYDNASGEPTASYLRDLFSRHDLGVLVRSETNDGFIAPNNRLAALSSSPYLVLLNSDTEVRPGWDLAMLNFLERDPEAAQVGYCGGVLGGDGLGGGEAAFGYGVDFVCGWCFCVPRRTYDGHGLFDEANLEFAYGEDSDLSLRLREAGKKVYSLHLDLVTHHGNKTIEKVHLEMGNYVRGTFQRNHDYLRKRWGRYLKK